MAVDLDAEEAVGADPADYIVWKYTRHDGGDAETLGGGELRVGEPVRHSPVHYPHSVEYVLCFVC